MELGNVRVSVVSENTGSTRLVNCLHLGAATPYIVHQLIFCRLIDGPNNERSLARTLWSELQKAGVAPKEAEVWGATLPLDEAIRLGHFHDQDVPPSRDYVSYKSPEEQADHTVKEVARMLSSLLKKEATGGC